MSIDLERVKIKNSHILNEAINSLDKHGYNPEDWSVMSQALDNMKDICKIERHSHCAVNPLKEAFMEFEEKRTTQSLRTMLDIMNHFVQDMKTELDEKEKEIVKASIKDMHDKF